MLQVCVAMLLYGVGVGLRCTMAAGNGLLHVCLLMPLLRGRLPMLSHARAWPFVCALSSAGGASVHLGGNSPFS